MALGKNPNAPPETSRWSLWSKNSKEKTVDVPDGETLNFSVEEEPPIARDLETATIPSTRTSVPKVEAAPQLERKQESNTVRQPLGTRQLHSDLAASQPDLETGTQNPQRERSEGSTGRKERNCIFGGLLLCLMLVGLLAGVGIAILLGKKQNPTRIRFATHTPVAAPSLRPTSLPSIGPTLQPVPAPSPLSFEDVICAQLSDCSALSDIFTPTGRAFDWVKSDPSQSVERFALAVFYFSTTGDSWIRRDGWLPRDGQSECNWFGVSCSTGGLVTSLKLEFNNVNGRLPSELGLLAKLTSLVIRNPPKSVPSMTGEIPRSLGELEELKTLVITGNNFSSQRIPQELGKLGLLEVLDLSANAFEGDLPTSFERLSNLREFVIEDNNLSSGVPDRLFRGMKKLETVNLRRNNISSLPSSIGNLVSLRKLQVSDNELIQLPPQLWSLVSLQELDISANGFQGPVPTSIGLMRGLSEVSLSTNNFAGGIPTELGMLVRTTRLDLSHNKLTGQIPTQLAQLFQLEELYLNKNLITGTLPALFTRLNQIRVLRTDHNILTPTFPPLLCDLHDVLKPVTYGDCDPTAADACYTFCCANDSCTCRHENTEPLRCFQQ